MSDKSEDRPIDANALCAILQAKADMAIKFEYKCAFLKANAIVNAMPTIDVEPVRHGRWIQNKTVPAYHHCSLCKVTRKMQASCNKYLMLRYCPHCGAKMDGGKDDENAQEV